VSERLAGVAVTNSPGVACTTSENCACPEMLELAQETVSADVPGTATLLMLNCTVCGAVLLRLKFVGLMLTPAGAPSMLQEAVELNPLAGIRLTVTLWLPLAVSVSELTERLTVKLGGLPPPPPPPPPLPPEEAPPPQPASADNSARKEETTIIRRGNALAFIDSFHC